MRLAEGCGVGAGAPVWSAGAIFAMGARCAAGRDAPPDLVAAHKWVNIAASLGCAEALDYRRSLAAEMTPKQIAEAQRQARAWLDGRSAAQPPLERRGGAKPAGDRASR